MNDSMKQLSQEREVIEKEVSELQKQIKTMEEAEGFDQSLVDREGFPRPDIDFGKLTQYKLLKKRLNELHTDHSNIMAKVENELFAIHKSMAESGQAQKDIEEYEANLDKKKEEREQKQREIDQMNELLKEKAAQKAAVKNIPVPFCEITAVVDKSPAYQDGLRVNDLVTAFAGISSNNFIEVNQLVEVVRHNINKEIPVKVLREQITHEGADEEGDTHTYKGKTYLFKEYTIIPRKWEGEGVLGCRFSQVI